MSRLDELRRQRTLLLDHLAWLDREIADANRGVDPAAARERGELERPAATVASSLPSTPASLAAMPADAIIATTIDVVPPAPVIPSDLAATPEAILDQYRTAPDMLRQDVRKGCFLYFALAFVLLGVGITALYVLFRL